MYKTEPILPGTALEPARCRTAGRWCIELLPCQPYAARYTARQPVVGFAFDSQAGVHAIGGDRVIPFLAYPNGLAFVPAGCDVFSRSEAGGEYLALRGAVCEGPAMPCSGHIDPQAIRAAHRLRGLLLGAGDPDTLLLEELAATLADRALLAGSPERKPEPPCRLTANRLRRIGEFIDAHLGENLGIRRMADELGLSEGAFSRAFRQATGKPPHAHVLDRRIAAARRLIAGTSDTLAHIAAATGFSSHGHMTDVFRQRLGIAPSQFRHRARGM